MRNDEALTMLQHALEVSMGHVVTKDHITSLKQWVRLEEDKSAGEVVAGIMICKTLIRELETCRETLPLHTATDSTPSQATPKAKAKKQSSDAGSSGKDVVTTTEADPLPADAPQDDKPPVEVSETTAETDDESLVTAGVSGEW